MSRCSHNPLQQRKNWPLLYSKLSLIRPLAMAQLRSSRKMCHKNMP